MIFKSISVILYNFLAFLIIIIPSIISKLCLRSFIVAGENNYGQINSTCHRKIAEKLINKNEDRLYLA